ncbi:MAG: hypothetical protein WCH43_00725, partial [Verrucomicrobiota bacterium]
MAAKRKRRWAVCLCRTILAFVLILLGFAFLAYRNLRDVVVWFANRSHSQLSLSLEKVEFTSLERLVFSGIVVKQRGTPEEVVRIDSANVDFKWSELRAHRISAVHLQSPRIRISDALLASEAGSKTPSGTTTGGATWLVKNFTVSSGTAELDFASYPVTRFEFAPEFHDLYLSPYEKTGLQPFNITLRHIGFTSRGAKPESLGGIDSIALKFSISEAMQMHLGEVVVRYPSLKLTPGVFTTFPTRKAEVIALTEPAAPVLRMDRLKVEAGELFVADFGAGIPDGSLKFSVNWHDLQLGGVGDATTELQSLLLWDIRLAPSFAQFTPFLTTDWVQIDFSTAGLISRHEIQSTKINGFTLTIGQQLRSLLAAGDSAKPTSTAATPASTGASWQIREVEINHSRVNVADLGVGVANLGFTIQTKLRDVPLAIDLKNASEQIVTKELADLSVTSPLDPFVPVFTLRTLFIRYSVAGLLRREIEEIQGVSPTIYVGPDLFWYFNELGKQQEKIVSNIGVPASIEPAWKLKKLGISLGQLVVTTGGQASVPLPLHFETTVENIDLAHLREARLALDLVVPQEDYEFASYQLSMK